MAKKYPVLYTTLVWIGIAAFGFVMFCGMYILSSPRDSCERRGGAPDAHRNRRGNLFARRYEPHLSRHVTVAQPRGIATADEVIE